MVRGLHSVKSGIEGIEVSDLATEINSGVVSHLAIALSLASVSGHSICVVVGALNSGRKRRSIYEQFS